ncbi:glutathione S-transferase family protein [Sphingomicrobium sediminis]|uniref:Glutathione S-transferase family protein n=1 Tax=Sphingomicrobium sediminis TaxID=2950949 RepID=A0A9X2J162_9SPHN|nr:glutathione S-transferase family protein [Sphingomicrobium sediminis]MCM8556389.1 glutathione S-transferase family protein [Sphingomicrobium sediminis]
MSLIFYTNPMSRGQIARWALHEVGADYEQKIVTYGPEMKSDYQRDVNPMGKVPAIDHDGKIVTEVAAICAYLADAFPDSELAPLADERADYYRWLFFAAGPVEASITNRNMGFEVDDPKKQGTLGYGNYELVMDTLDGLFSGRDFVCGDRFTMADVYVGCQIVWGLQFGTIPERESFKAYAARLNAREALQEARAIDMKLIAEAQAAQD